MAAAPAPRAQPTHDDALAALSLADDTLGGFLLRTKTLEWPSELVNAGKDFFDAAKGISPLLQSLGGLEFIGPALGVIGLLLDTAVTFSDNKRKCADLLSRVRVLLNFQLKHGRDGEALKLAQERLVKATVSSLATVLKFGGLNNFRRFLGAHSDAEKFEDCHSLLNQCLLDFSGESLIDLTTTLEVSSKATLTALEEMRHRMDESDNNMSKGFEMMNEKFVGLAGGHQKLTSLVEAAQAANASDAVDYFNKIMEVLAGMKPSLGISLSEFEGRVLLLPLHSAWAAGYMHYSNDVSRILNKAHYVLSRYDKDIVNDREWSGINAGRCLLFLDSRKGSNKNDATESELLVALNQLRRVGRALQRKLLKDAPLVGDAFWSDACAQEIFNILRMTWILDAANYCLMYDMGMNEADFTMENLPAILMMAFRSNDVPNHGIVSLMSDRVPGKRSGLPELILKGLTTLPSQHRFSEAKKDGVRTDRTDLIVKWLQDNGITDVDRSKLPA